MALICPNCQARNRSIAKFCIECITSLPTGCAETDFAPTQLAASKTSYLDRAFALKAHWSKPSGQPRAEGISEAAPAAKGVWISIAGLMAALAIGSAGWLVAGAGGWYLYTAGSAQVDPPRPHSPGVVAAIPGDEPSPPPAHAPAPVAPTSDQVRAPVQLAPPVEESSASLPSDDDGPAAAPAVATRRAPPRRAAALAASPPAQDVAAPASQAPSSTDADDPKPKAPAAPEPAAACSSLNFIAKSQCMAAQCLKREFRSHAQCEAVRRRQRLEEEKRNPPAP
ncbi:zinc ribbon domain-containing protein [Variovorax sp. J22R115]|uniref:zinc ribbon domain-containing protein n=1 Tax=Variovorax sp. J22R115 TaxID=3053509 RepID=UPI0025765C6F|nr:zinc ribbon domain-containing protein [Variovorax sp. J22R115]MDM0047858.1 zinc ribbon domain-containing protein [Variovorax sp. J22R115]